MSALISLASMIAALCLALLLARLLWWFVDEYVIEWAYDRQASLMSKINVSGVGVPPLLCGSVSGDEAARWLATIRVVGNIGHMGFGAVAGILRYGWAIFLLLTLLTVMQVSIPKIGGLFEGMFNGVGLLVEWFMVAAIILQIIMVVLPAITRGHRFGFGEGNPADNWLCDVAISTTPVGIPCELFKLSVNGKVDSTGLRHSSFYEDEHFLSFVGSWMRRKSTGQSG